MEVVKNYNVSKVEGANLNRHSSVQNWYFDAHRVARIQILKYFAIIGFLTLILQGCYLAAFFKRPSYQYILKSINNTDTINDYYQKNATSIFLEPYLNTGIDTGPNSFEYTISVKLYFQTTNGFKFNLTNENFKSYIVIENDTIYGAIREFNFISNPTISDNLEIYGKFIFNKGYRTFMDKHILVIELKYNEIELKNLYEFKSN